MQPSHLRHDDSASNGSEQLDVPQGTYRRILTSALGFVQDVYRSASRPPTPSPGMVSEGYRDSYDCDERSRGNVSWSISSSARPSIPTPSVFVEHLSVSEDSFLPQPSPPSITNTIPPDPTHRPPSASPAPAASVSFLEGAVDTTFNNSIINNIGGNATILKLDGDGPVTEEFKSLFVDHLAGVTVTQELCAKVEKHVLSQSICNLPRAKAAYDDYAYKDRKRVSCFENTRQTVRKEIGEWFFATLDKPEIYLLSGLAGIGKSTVAQTIAERADSVHLLGASFFFSRDEPDRRNAEKFYTTIAFQLCAHDKQFAQAIGNVLLEEKGASATSKEPREQLDALIVEPLRGLLDQRSRPLVIVVDALDECDEEDALIVLETLERLVRELSSLRVVLTSRPRPLLDGYFDNHRVFHMHNIEDKVVDNDIRLYLKYRLSREEVRSHLKLKTQWGANEEEIETLVRASGRLFVIASTAVLFILDKAARNPASQMKKLQIALSQDRTPFNALNEFYTVILRSAVPTDCDQDILERYQAVIGTIVVIQDPLPIAKVSNLIGFSSEDVRAVLDNLQSVILVGDNDIPRVYHKLFLDYIQDTTRCKDNNLQIVPRDQHTRITVCCFDVMKMCLKRNIVGLGTPAQYMENTDGLKADGISDDRLREKILPELRYACVYWAKHFEGADIEDINLIKKADAFAKEHLLYWLEVLSWIGKLDLAPRVLLTVHNLLKRTPSDTCEILFDASLFISKSYDVIRRSALHMYHSALPFAPTKILLTNVYKKEDSLCHLAGGPERWDALVAIAKHEGVNRIAFSQDSFHLAVWGTGPGGTTEMKLWDAPSGTPVKTFNGDKIALARDFSILALSEDNDLTLYDVTSDAPIANCTIPSANVVELTLSFDGSRLAAGLSDGTVNLWDSRGMGGSIASFDGYAREGGQLEFSPSGYHLAFLSGDGSIRLRNGFNGESIAILNYRSEMPVQFVFSHCGSRLAALAKKDAVYHLALWNGENGKFIGVAMNVGDELAISDDASLIATGGRMKGVQLWSGNSLSLVDTLDNWGDIYSLAFSRGMLAIGSYEKLTLYDLQTRAIITSVKSPNTPTRLALSPNRLAAVATSGAVRLWDVQSMKASASESMKKTRIVTALAFSPDRFRLASGFRGGTVELWDTGRTEQVIATLKLHSDEITALAFSADGEKLVSGSRDETLRLWGGRDAAPSGVLEHSFRKPLTSVAFSSRLLAVQTEDNLTIFDCKTLHPVHTFSAGGHHLLFSPNGSLLACAHISRFPYVSGTYIALRNVETLRLLARFEDRYNRGIQKLVFSPDDSQLAALTGLGFEFIDVINKHTITDPEHEETSWIFRNGTLISRPSPFSPGGGPLLGHFPEHRGGVPILWMPRDVGISAFTVESSTFALACGDGRLMIGLSPLPFLFNNNIFSFLVAYIQLSRLPYVVSLVHTSPFPHICVLTSEVNLTG